MKKVLLLFLGVILLSAQSQPDKPLKSKSDLFTSDETLEMVIKTDIGGLFKDRGEERDYHPAEIIYKDGDSEEVNVPLKVKVRGNFRRKGGICRIPPIRLNFAKATSGGTIFEGEDKIKLVTHCQKNSPKYAQYLLQEYLVYRIYNLVSEYSFKVRLVKIRYEDSAGKWKPMDTYAFMIEDEDMMAERLGGTIKEQVMVHPTGADEFQTTLMAVFAYCVGNTDWSIPQLHNVKLLLRENQPLIPIPYDFDWCGIVNAPYAIPNPAIFDDLPNVRTRRYRGFERDEEVFQDVFKVFNEKKEEIYALYKNCDGMLNSQKKLSTKYLDDFYKTINTPKLVKRNIYNRAR